MAIKSGEDTFYQAKRGIVQDGLVLNLDAGVRDSYIGSGSTWTDLEESNNGTLNNDATFDADYGGGIILDGTDDHVEIPDINDINLTSVSFSVCLKLDNLDTDYDIFSKGTHGQRKPILCWFDSSVSSSADVGNGSVRAISFLTHDGQTQVWVSSPSDAVVADEIFILDITIDASAGTVSLYKNGDLLNSYTNASYDGIQNTTEQIRLGVDKNISKDLPGIFYFFRIYNKCLTASEVSRNFNALKHRFGI